jgi:hypothetical protein
MKGLAALAVAAAIAAAGGFFMSNPVVVTAQVKPLPPSADIPTFKSVRRGLERQRPRR